MSYGGHSTPWQRSVGSFQQGGASQQMYNMNQQYGQNQMQSSGGSGGMYSSNSNSAVAYPARATGMNAAAFGTSGSGHAQHYNSIGTVTKINNECGLVNEEVLFYRNVCKGAIPKLGDRVLFEATYSATGQFEWNATRIQLMPQQPQPLLGKNTDFGAVAPPSDFVRGRKSPRRSPMRSDHRHPRDDRHSRPHRTRDNDEDLQDRKRRREDHDRSRDRNIVARHDHNTTERKDRAERERERDRELREHRDKERQERERAERSPHRPALKGRRARAIRRYMVQIPKDLLPYKSAGVQELHQRYTNLYIPSDFFHAKMKWPESFTPDNPLSLRRPCQFRLMNKAVEPLTPYNLEELEPADADYLYSAKVMLLSIPSLTEIYQKCIENDDDFAAEPPSSLASLISFLVGLRGRNEPAAIGGPWSPSLDGENPEEDPAVLIRTAIRTCRSLTGIDLSNCTQWYRFVEFYYHRTDYKNKEKDGPPRVETVVIFLPDVHSCMPNAAEWEKLKQLYKTNCDNIIARNAVAAKAAAASTNDETAAADKSADESHTENAGAADADAVDDTTHNKADADATAAAAGNDSIGVAQPVEPMATDGDDNANEKDGTLEPTHYSKLELKTMKLQEIRNELEARQLPAKGAKTVLMARLAKALNEEKAAEHNAKKNATEPTAVAENGTKDGEAEEAANAETADTEKAAEAVTDSKNEAAADNEQNEENADDVDMNDIVILDEYDSNKNMEEPAKEMDEKDKSILIRRYTLPDEPHIIVHANQKAKGGKFDCGIATLASLLDYVPDDMKERCFEVYVFAELFNDMLTRDFGFNIYKEIYLYNETANERENSETKDQEEKAESQNGSAADDGKASDAKSVSEVKASGDAKVSKTSAKDKEKEKEKEKGKDKDKEKEKEKEKEEKKMIVVKPHLLLSFVFFDTTHCGYIFERDLESLFSVLGLELSRGQIRKTLSKFGGKQSFHYRKLTDREAAAVSTPVIEDVDAIDCAEVREIALGNNIYGITDVGDKQMYDGMETAEEGLVNYNGTVVHIGKLMEQIKRTEKNYADVEKLYNDLRKQHTELQKEHTRAENKIKVLSSDCKSFSRKLNDANTEIASLNRKYRDQQTTLQFIYNRVQPYFEREKKDKEKEKEKEKDKDAKSEGSQVKEEKEKEKKKEAKENGKEKDVKETKVAETKNGKDAKDKDKKETEKKSANEKEKAASTPAKKTEKSAKEKTDSQTDEPMQE